MRRNDTPEKRGERAAIRDALKKFNWRLLAVLVLACAVSSILYFVLIDLGGRYPVLFKITTASYAVLLAAAAVAYVAYNRGFAARGVTEDMLPDSMSPEEKREYVESAALREKRSKWLLIAMIALALPLLVDLFRLFVWDSVTGALRSMLGS
jgi:hypothetical protein